jgi:hypothetical protein
LSYDFHLIAETINNEQEASATTSNYDILTVEQKKLHQLQEALLGVPPPPSITIPQLDVTDILRLLKENTSLMILTDTESEAGKKLITEFICMKPKISLTLCLTIEHNGSILLLVIFITNL